MIATLMKDGKTKDQQTGDRKIDFQVLLADLKQCSKTQNLKRGKQVHAKVLEWGLDSSNYIASALINMYAKCGSMLDARKAFEIMKHPSVVSWNALILGYVDNGQCFIALALFVRMKSEGLAPDVVTCIAALKACSTLAGNEIVKTCVLGKVCHNLAIENGCTSNIYVQNMLIDMYGNTCSMFDAFLVFDSMKHTDVVSWTALILGYAENGEGPTALRIFVTMRTRGLAPNCLTFVASLKACTSLAGNGKDGVTECRYRGINIHNLVMETECGSDMYVQNTLIDMYSKCGSIEQARQVFDIMRHPNMVSWTALILGYADSGEGLVALDLFRRMSSPGSLTFVAALKACICLAADGYEQEDRGKQIHNLVIENGCDSNIYVQSTLINMYGKYGCMVDAHQIFDNEKHPDVVSWTGLIMGYASIGKGLAALELFTKMRSRGPAPDSVVFSAALKACSLLGALEFGRNIHSEMGNDIDVVLVNCLVDFYGKCGSLVEAQTVFELFPKRRDMITWNTLLVGFSTRGDSVHTFELFEGMQNASFKPDGITLLSVLTCCSHAGLVEKGKECFQTMYTKYGLSPGVEHYTCMLDILGRANKLADAMALLRFMSCSPNYVTWMTILGACRKWKIMRIGRLAFQSLMNLNDGDMAACMLMGQIYGSTGMLQEQELVMLMRK